jgi:hypothetical protein
MPYIYSSEKREKDREKQMKANEMWDAFEAEKRRFHVGYAIRAALESIDNIKPN